MAITGTNAAYLHYTDFPRILKESAANNFSNFVQKTVARELCSGGISAAVVVTLLLVMFPMVLYEIVFISSKNKSWFFSKYYSRIV